jgi:hypothetical protein
MLPSIKKLLKLIINLKILPQRREPVAHACNPSYSGGRDQEDLSSKSAQAKSSARPYLDKSLTKTGVREWLKAKTEFKPQYRQKKKNNK